MPFVYFCFVINILLGVWISKKPTVLRILGTTILASTIFFIVTNFGVWLVGGLYPASVQGLALCYINAIPFARNTLLGDLVFVGALFGLTELIKKYHNVSSLERRKYQEVEIIRSNLSSDNKLS